MIHQERMSKWMSLPLLEQFMMVSHEKDWRGISAHICWVVSLALSTFPITCFSLFLMWVLFSLLISVLSLFLWGQFWSVCPHNFTILIHKNQVGRSDFHITASLPIPSIFFCSFPSSWINIKYPCVLCKPLVVPLHTFSIAAQTHLEACGMLAILS